LTPSQAASRARIEERLAYPGAVNLYGLHGVGKTFLAWTLSAEKKALYVVHPSRLRDVVDRATTSDTVVVVDNVAEDRSSFRQMMIGLESLGDPKVVVISHRRSTTIFSVSTLN
jgi:hypothetical protein